MKYRKKPIVVDAIRFDGENFDEITNFAGKDSKREGRYIYIFTLEGVMETIKGDWIIKGTRGEFYPCKPNVFSDVYEEI